MSLAKNQGSDPMRTGSDKGSDPTRLTRRSRRSFLSRSGSLLAGLLAGVPLIRRGFSRGRGDSPSPEPGGSGKIQARIHPMAVPRTSTSSIPNV